MKLNCLISVLPFLFFLFIFSDLQELKKKKGPKNGQRTFSSDYIYKEMLDIGIPLL